MVALLVVFFVRINIQSILYSKYYSIPAKLLRPDNKYELELLSLLSLN